MKLALYLGVPVLVVLLAPILFLLLMTRGDLRISFGAARPMVWEDAGGGLEKGRGVLCGSFHHGIWVVPEGNPCVHPTSQAGPHIHFNSPNPGLGEWYKCVDCDWSLVSRQGDDGVLVEMTGELEQGWFSLHLSTGGSRPIGFGKDKSVVAYSRDRIVLHSLRVRIQKRDKSRFFC